MKKEKKIREEVLLDVQSIIGGLGVGGKGKYQDGFRDAIEMAVEQIEILLEDDDN